MNIVALRKNIMFNTILTNSINPLQTFPGYIMIEKDIPVYENVFNDGKLIERKDVGLLKAGTVIEIDGIPTDGYIFVVKDLSLQGLIKASDIELLTHLNKSVAYKMIDEKLYRFIEGRQIEIDIDTSGYYENGYRYIRNEFNNHSLDAFYFWEILGDYLFDENGDFVDVVGYGPDWTGK